MNAYRDAVNAFRRDLLTRTLEAHGGNRAQAAKALGVDPEYFRALARKFNVGGPGKPGRPGSAR